MKGKIFVLTLAAMALLVLQGCGGGAQPKETSSSDYEVVEDPFQGLTDISQSVIDDGGVAAVGIGRSSRMDLAKEKARTDGQGKLAEIFDTKVQRLKKSFQEELGTADDTEINEAFTTVTKTVSSKVLKGAVVKTSKIIKQDGQYVAGVVVEISPKTANLSIMDEMKNNKKLYERFRASQAYKDLEKEMEKYEGEKEN